MAGYVHQTTQHPRLFKFRFFNTTDFVRDHIKRRIQMSKKHIFTGVIFLTMIVAIVWSLSWSGAFAQATHSGHDHSEHGMSSPAEHNSTGTDHPSETLSAPHGGQINKTANYNIEIVYLPKEIRVYLYDSKDKPVAPHGATGQIVMQ